MTTLPQLCHVFAKKTAKVKINKMVFFLPFDHLLINKIIFIINIARKGKNETIYLTFRGHSVTFHKYGKVAKLSSYGILPGPGHPPVPTPLASQDQVLGGSGPCNQASAGTQYCEMNTKKKSTMEV